MKTSGFSLVELMVTILIFAILIAVAYPTYIGQLTKTRRTNAMGILAQDAASLERFYTSNGCYNNVGADLICGTSDDTPPTLANYCSPSSSIYNAQSKSCDSNGFYVISVNTAPSCPFPCPVTSGSTSTCTYTSGSAYLLTATPQGTQVSDGVLTLQSDGSQGWPNNPSKNVCSWQ